MFLVLVTSSDGEELLELAESPSLAAMMQLVGLIAEHATEEITAVEVLERPENGHSEVRFAYPVRRMEVLSGSGLAG